MEIRIWIKCTVPRQFCMWCEFRRGGWSVCGGIFQCLGRKDGVCVGGCCSVQEFRRGKWCVWEDRALECDQNL